MKFGVWFVISAQAVFFFFVGTDLDFGSANLPVGLGSCLLLVLLIHLVDRAFPCLVRIDGNRRIYVNGVPYYRLVLATIAALILMAIIVWAMPGLSWRDVFHLSK